MSELGAPDIKLEVVPVQGGQVLRLSGVLNETLLCLRPPPPADMVLVDFDKVSQITSTGVREWMRFREGIQTSYLGFINCRPSVVYQFNMMPRFAGTGQLISFYLPYTCGACHHYFEVVVDLRHNYEAVQRMQPPERNCPRCRARAEFDDLPDTYFAYAAAAGPPTPPTQLDAMLLGKERAPVLRVGKDVQGGLSALWLTGPLDGRARVDRVAAGLEGEVLVVCQGVTSVDDEGMARFSALLELPVELSLARVPVPMMQKLLRVPRPLRVQSLWARTDCPSCGKTQECEVHPQLASFARTAPCADCGADVSFAIPEELHGVKGCTLSPQAAEYLRCHRGAPELGAGGSSAAFLGRYRVLRSLGMGGMAEVFLAEATGVGGFKKAVALKKMLPTVARTRTLVDFFLNEARLAARISHPNVVQIYDVGQIGSEFCIAMEYVHGLNLNQVLNLTRKLGSSMPLDLALYVGASLASGLQAAHACVDERGRKLEIVHRDISPHNVLVSFDGAVKLGDFGIARACDSKVPGDARVLGKLRYAAPEQVKEGDHPVAQATDLFSLGIVIYELVTLSRPFMRQTDAESVQALFHDELPAPQAASGEGVPPRLGALLVHATRKDPRERPASAGSIATELTEILVEQGRASGAPQLAAWLGELLKKGTEHKLLDARDLARLQFGPAMGQGTETTERTAVVERTAPLSER